jgi:hypothetical protein
MNKQLKPYRLKIRLLLIISSIISIFVFSLVLIVNLKKDTEKFEEILLHYGLIILPISFLW